MKIYGYKYENTIKRIESPLSSGVGCHITDVNTIKRIERAIDYGLAQIHTQKEYNKKN